MRLIIAFIIVVGCWLFPLGDATTVSDMVVRSGFSLGVMTVMLLLSADRWSISIMLIEFGLVIINTIIINDWPAETWLMIHCKQINTIAVATEALIILGAGRHGILLFLDDFADSLRAYLNRYSR